MSVNVPSTPVIEAVTTIGPVLLGARVAVLPLGVIVPAVSGLIDQLISSKETSLGVKDALSSTVSSEYIVTGALRINLVAYISEVTSIESE